MKIIKEGRKEFIVSKFGVCLECECEFELEVGDSTFEEDGKEKALCPNCGHLTELKKEV